MLEYCLTADSQFSRLWAERYFGYVIQLLSSRNERVEWQNLGQGLQVFKYTIAASTQGQGEFSAIICRLLKYLRGNIHILKWVISVLTRLQVPQTSDTF